MWNGISWYHNLTRNFDDQITLKSYKNLLHFTVEQVTLRHAREKELCVFMTPMSRTYFLLLIFIVLCYGDLVLIFFSLLIHNLMRHAWFYILTHIWLSLIKHSLTVDINSRYLLQMSSYIASLRWSAKTDSLLKLKVLNI